MKTLLVIFSYITEPSPNFNIDEVFLYRANEHAILTLR